MPKTAFSDSEWAVIDERVKKEGLRPVARDVGMNPTAMSRMLQRKFGRIPRPKKPVMTREMSDAIYERVLRGESVLALARETGQANSSNLYRLLENRYGYKPAEMRRAVWESAYRVPTEVSELAYIAGIIDGEGSVIRISRCSTYALWIVKVGMTDEAVMTWLASFGGSLRERPAPKEKPHYKLQWVWNLSRQIDVQALLEAIVPYMIVKRARAQEALDYFASTTPMRPSGRHSQTIAA